MIWKNGLKILVILRVDLRFENAINHKLLHQIIPCNSCSPNTFHFRQNTRSRIKAIPVQSVPYCPSGNWNNDPRYRSCVLIVSTFMYLRVRTDEGTRMRFLHLHNKTTAPRATRVDQVGMCVEGLPFIKPPPLGSPNPSNHHSP